MSPGLTLLNDLLALKKKEVWNASLNTSTYCRVYLNDTCFLWTIAGKDPDAPKIIETSPMGTVKVEDVGIKLDENMPLIKKDSPVTLNMVMSGGWRPWHMAVVKVLSVEALTPGCCTVPHCVPLTCVRSCN